MRQRICAAQERRHSNILITSIVCAFLSLHASLVTGVYGEEPPELSGQSDPTQLSRAFRQAAEKVLPACVTIETMSGPRKTLQWAMHERNRAITRRSPGNTPDAESLQSTTVGYARDGSGSGIIIDRRGYVLTCSHVVSDADTVFVRLANGSRLTVTDVWSDAFTDIAILHIIPIEELQEVQLGDSSELVIGDWVVSVGNPYGLGSSISGGIISATDRELADTPGSQLLQSDAASNPGNSGGALINLKGEVIGISEGSYGANKGFQGISLAIPINAANRIARQLIEHGTIRRASLGCHIESLSPDMTRQLKLPQSGGVIVCDVTSRSPAENAGIHLGDVLIEFASVPLRNASHLYQMLETAKPNEPLNIQLYREGELLSTFIRLRPPVDRQKPLEVPPVPEPIHESRYTDRLLGLKLDDLSGETASQLGYARANQGVLITQVLSGSVAHQEGLCAGMLILRIGNDETPNIEGFQKAMAGRNLEKGILLLVTSSTQKSFVVLRQ